MVRNAKVFDLDNSQFFRISLAQVIAKTNRVVGAREGATQEIEYLKAEPYDLAMNHPLAGRSRPNLTPRVWNIDPDIPVLMPRYSDSLSPAPKALKVGARDCLAMEPVEPQNIIRYIRLAIADRHHN
jgi:DNA-binding NarL/FixJ family response regulator